MLSLSLVLLRPEPAPAPAGAEAEFELSVVHSALGMLDHRLAAAAVGPGRNDGHGAMGVRQASYNHRQDR